MVGLQWWGIGEWSAAPLDNASLCLKSTDVPNAHHQDDDNGNDNDNNNNDNNNISNANKNNSSSSNSKQPSTDSRFSPRVRPFTFYSVI